MLVRLCTVGFQVSYECSGMKDDRMTILFNQSAVVGRELRDPLTCADELLDRQSQCAIHPAIVTARCMTAFQNGLLTLRKLRQEAHQRITVQYVNVSNGSQASTQD